MNQGIATNHRVRHIATGATGTVTRVISAGGALGGLVEVRWDGRKLSRSAGFEATRNLEAAEGPLRHKTGLVTLG